ncbi:MAG TPA: serine hydrolase [Candidatus Saccharimonadales bacterium]|nr:serine hydrolase [Candidatus Saccharimonadales bacterium]
MNQPPKQSRSNVAIGWTILLLVVGSVAYAQFGHWPFSRPKTHTDSGLQSVLASWSSQHAFDSAVDVHELTGTLRTAAQNSTTQMTTASTYKVYVAYATLHEVEQGRYTMNSPTRTGQTVSQALSKMILQSDNASAEALGFLVGWNRINSLAASAGATHTDINNYDSAGNATNGSKLSTAADLALMVTKLQQGNLLSKSHTDLLLNLMRQQIWRERVPAGVPAGVTVADKPGWLSNVQNDAAIVYGPKSTYVLVVMTNGSTTQPLADLSRTVYNYLEQ